MARARGAAARHALGDQWRAPHPSTEPSTQEGTMRAESRRELRRLGRSLSRAAAASARQCRTRGERTQRLGAKRPLGSSPRQHGDALAYPSPREWPWSRAELPQEGGGHPHAHAAAEDDAHGAGAIGGEEGRTVDQGMRRRWRERQRGAVGGGVRRDQPERVRSDWCGRRVQLQRCGLNQKALQRRAARPARLCDIGNLIPEERVVAKGSGADKVHGEQSPHRRCAAPPRERTPLVLRELRAVCREVVC
mmetsp:Transcript_41255/g.96405  ORF Transcript_41255/g.96405 Transcript_41255/m.96405 type:complete len:249 (-) Transcript_41255:1297-2043(-)